MSTLRFFLIVSTVAIYVMTVIASASSGLNWPAVAVGDLLALNWRSQFNLDFIVYLLLFAAWVTWRQGGTAKAYALGVVSVLMGGMFAFPYLLWATYVAKGDPRGILLGSHEQRTA